MLMKFTWNMLADELFDYFTVISNDCFCHLTNVVSFDTFQLMTERAFDFHV